MLSNIKFEGVTPMRRLIEKFPEVAKVRKKFIFLNLLFLWALFRSLCLTVKKRKSKKSYWEEKGESAIIINSQIMCYLAASNQKNDQNNSPPLGNLHHSEIYDSIEPK